LVDAEGTRRRLLERRAGAVRDLRDIADRLERLPLDDATDALVDLEPQLITLRKRSALLVASGRHRLQIADRETLPPFSGQGGTCPGCGRGPGGFRVHFDHAPCRRVTSADHFHRACGACGHEWVER
jgi:hypothetical protein